MHSSELTDAVQAALPLKTAYTEALTQLCLRAPVAIPKFQMPGSGEGWGTYSRTLRDREGGKLEPSRKQFLQLQLCVLIVYYLWIPKSTDLASGELNGIQPMAFSREGLTELDRPVGLRVEPSRADMPNHCTLPAE